MTNEDIKAYKGMTNAEGEDMVLGGGPSFETRGTERRIQAGTTSPTPVSPFKMAMEIKNKLIPSQFQEKTVYLIDPQFKDKSLPLSTACILKKSMGGKAIYIEVINSVWVSKDPVLPVTEETKVLEIRKTAIWTKPEIIDSMYPCLDIIQLPPENPQP